MLLTTQIVVLKFQPKTVLESVVQTCAVEGGTFLPPRLKATVSTSLLASRNPSVSVVKFHCTNFFSFGHPPSLERVPAVFAVLLLGNVEFCGVERVQRELDSSMEVRSATGYKP